MPYTMVMVDSCEQMAEIHDRMPVILKRDQWEQWTQGAALVSTSYALQGAYAAMLTIAGTMFALKISNIDRRTKLKGSAAMLIIVAVFFFDDATGIERRNIFSNYVHSNPIYILHPTFPFLAVTSLAIGLWWMVRNRSELGELRGLRDRTLVTSSRQKQILGPRTVTHLYKYLDGGDETMLRYINNCQKSLPYEPNLPTLSIPVESQEELICLHDMLVEMIRSTREDFIRSVEGACSSDALDFAYRFKNLDRMRTKVVAIAISTEGADWVRSQGW